MREVRMKMAKLVMAQIDSQLAAKGLTKTDGDKADLYVGYQGSIDQERQWNAYGTGGLRWGGGMANATTSKISIGTLVLDMYDPANKQVDFAHEAGFLLPIEKLEIKDVVTAMLPVGKGSRRQVMAVFQKEGKTYAVPIGYEADEQYKIYSDEMFFVEDPHELYKHWPPDVWQAVAQHEVKPGMTEMQADFAIGMGVPDAGASSAEKTVRYPNGGKPLVVTYRGGSATEIKPGA